MRAVIFNSGVGKRMGALTENSHKSMVTLSNGEPVFRRQLRILRDCGITDFVITVGPHAQQLVRVSEDPALSGCTFTFVENPEYLSTNYIYSMHLAAEYFDDDVLMLHGDLVFDTKLIDMVLAHPSVSVATYNPNIPQPEKDFKARVVDGRLLEVSVSIFGDDCFAFQPIYRLSASDAAAWVSKVAEYVHRGDTGVYAENALNEILSDINIQTISYEDHFAEEIDTPDDLRKVSAAIRRFDFDQQKVIQGDAGPAIKEILEREHISRYMVVCGDYFASTPLKEYLDSLSAHYVTFSDFQPNPLYEEAVAGVELYRDSGSEMLVSIGGGSAIDVAKAIKLYLAMDSNRSYIEQDFVFSPIRHASVPTTAGTGSESTRYSVLYYKDVKQSITHDSAVPEYVVLDPALLATLPPYQRRATMLDAFSQAIESYWSVNSSDQSKAYSAHAIELFLGAYEPYLEGDSSATADMLLASNLAGKAINITQTTAPHAMSYKLTSVFGLAHGHTVALCVPAVWRYMLSNTSSAVDPRGPEYLKRVFAEIAELLGVDSPDDAVEAYEAIVNYAGLVVPERTDGISLEELAKSVNPTRLGNSPVPLSHEILVELYGEILGG